MAERAGDDRVLVSGDRWPRRGVLRAAGRAPHPEARGAGAGVAGDEVWRRRAGSSEGERGPSMAGLGQRGHGWTSARAGPATSNRRGGLRCVRRAEAGYSDGCGSGYGRRRGWARPGGDACGRSAYGAVVAASGRRSACATKRRGRRGGVPHPRCRGAGGVARGGGRGGDGDGGRLRRSNGGTRQRRCAAAAVGAPGARPRSSRGGRGGGWGVRASSDTDDGKGRRSAAVVPKAASGVEGEPLDPEKGSNRGGERGSRVSEWEG
nr:spidroin-1-like [Aegilops tauschii subsp. strangulata]